MKYIVYTRVFVFWITRLTYQFQVIWNPVSVVLFVVLWHARTGSMYGPVYYFSISRYARTLMLFMHVHFCALLIFHARALLRTDSLSYTCFLTLFGFMLRAHTLCYIDSCRFSTIVVLLLYCFIASIHVYVCTPPVYFMGLLCLSWRSWVSKPRSALVAGLEHGIWRDVPVGVSLWESSPYSIFS